MYAVKKTVWLFGCIVLMGLMGVTVQAASRAMIEGVPIISQKPELPTGCEATAATMILNYSGVNVTKEEVARSIPTAPIPTVKNGHLYGESPNQYFLGDPFKADGYGVYAPVMMEVLNKYVPGRVGNLTGGSFSEVLNKVGQGIPVMIWTTIGMKAPEVTKEWTTPTGELVEWKAPEHAVVVVGYDAHSIYINDPYTGRQAQYNKQTVLDRWTSMGKQALYIADEPIVTNSKTNDKTNNGTTQDVILKDEAHKNIGTTDATGEWVLATSLPQVHKQTQVFYNTKDRSVEITVSKEERLPSIRSHWIGSVGSKNKQAIPYNVDGSYYIKMKLPLDGTQLYTYDEKGKRLVLDYKLIDGKLYVSSEWVKSFYKI